MITLVRSNLESILWACQRFDVERLWIFGSALRDDWIEGRSDVDFVAEFGKSDLSLFRQHMGLIVQLQDILGIDVDVIDSRSMKKVEFIEEVRRTRELLYERSHRAISA
ncbi:MAG: nucleotidyltransferase domain-containing protein [Thermomicrobiales bacterium]|nr:nucleotidyltransferase domain-containing protein [Thermomicrobiales bacterium]